MRHAAHPHLTGLVLAPAVRAARRACARAASRHLLAASGLFAVLAPFAWAESSAAEANAMTWAPPGPMEGAPASWRLGFESIELPGNEHVGLLGTGVLIGLDGPKSSWFVGPMIYSAASGRRGGLFVIGAEALWRSPGPLGSRIEAGVFAGGGGGAAAPVGGGLMLRPQVTWSWPLGVGWLGATASRVTFPSGDIRSTQFGLSYSIDDRVAFRMPGSAVSPTVGRGGLGFDRFWLQVGQYRDPPRGNYGYGGIRGDQWVRPGIYVGLEASGAAQGGAAGGSGGYAELLGLVGAEWPLFGNDRQRGLQVGVRGAAGLAGGGAIDTGGGPLLKLAGTLTWPLPQDLLLGFEAGRTVAPDGAVRATHFHLSLGLTLDRPLAAGMSSRYSPAASSRTAITRHDTIEWTGALSHFPRVQFRDGSTDSLQTVGVRLRRALSPALDPRLQLAGGIHFAAGGRAGAYGTGLIGLAWASPLAKPGFQWGAELLAGAAGGGGLDTRGGAVVQPMLRAGWASGAGRWQLGVGRIKSREGRLDANVIELSVGVALDVPRR